MRTSLQRVAFRVSRLAEFCGERELTAQTGHPSEEWPLVILKELVDNALDECEEAEISPSIAIEVSTDPAQIIITDNGRGMPCQLIKSILDYTTRTSSREAYCSPTRGAQGNALKTIVAMPFALDGARGVTMIEARKQQHRIIFEMDPVRREPKILTEISPSLVQNGSRVTVRWPESASARKPVLYKWRPPSRCSTRIWHCPAGGGELLMDVLPTAQTWRKWRACDPTSAHWYNADRFSRYIAAHIARDEDERREGRTVREFISELRGLARSDKQKAVLDAAQASGVRLADFFQRGDESVNRLLVACQSETKPVAPKELGLIGSDHLREYCVTVGGAEESFKYRRQLGEGADGLPYAIEVAFAYCPEASQRRLTTGVNFSVGIRNPFQCLGYGSDLSSLLTARWAGRDEPVVFVLHYSCARVDYTDRGKSTLSLSYTVGRNIEALVELVTKDWYAQRKREQREASRRSERRDRLIAQQKTSIKDAAWQVMETAYLKASSNGTLPVKPRQIMYAARPTILALAGKDHLDDAYFTQTLLVDFINDPPQLCERWDITWDARGSFVEPHTNEVIPLGTAEVRRYLRSMPSGIAPLFETPSVDFGYSDRFPTHGPKNRFETVLFVEKEGFEPLFKAARIAERFDVAIMSTKGMSVTAARHLVDKLSYRGVNRILVLHDFDVSGFSISGTLGTTNRRYTFENEAPLIDIGLRLEDVEAMDLESEPVSVSGDWAKRAATLRRHGASTGEIAFLRTQRVELNAMTSRQIIDFIEAKFAEHGVEKLIPDGDVIVRHARRVIAQQLLAKEVEKIAAAVAEQAATADLPANMQERIQEIFAEQAAVAWDDAVSQIVRD